MFMGTVPAGGVLLSFCNLLNDTLSYIEDDLNVVVAKNVYPTSCSVSFPYTTVSKARSFFGRTDDGMTYELGGIGFPAGVNVTGVVIGDTSGPPVPQVVWLYDDDAV